MANWVERYEAGGTVVAEDIAFELNWPVENGSRRGRFDGCLLLTLGEEPALAIADRGDDPIAFAYHSGYEWVLDARRQEVPRLLNTCWRRDGRVYELQLGGGHRGALLDALTPRGFEEDLPAATSRTLLEFDHAIDTIETSLISKLANLRRIAFRYTRGNPDDIDHNIHLLITQFFVLRAIEDIGLGALKDIPPLADAIISGELDIERLDLIYGAARESIQANLFSLAPYRNLAPLSIISSIEALYTQAFIPNQPRLNFAWIDPDVFGRVYERYLSTILTESPLSGQLDLFENPLRDVEEVTQRKKRGVYYTPQPLVRILVQKAIDLARPDGVLAENLPRIADFSCGSGAFLVGALDKVLRSLPEDKRTEATRKMIGERKIIGVDIDARAVELARLNIYLRMAQENNILPLPDVNNCVVVADTLAGPLPDGLDELEYDAVVGNPPFLATARISDREQLERSFETASGRYDFSSLFVEFGINKVNVGGAVALVVPNRLFTNKSAQIARDFVIKNANIELLVDFGSAGVFEGVAAYIGLIVCSKRRAEQPGLENYRYVRVKSIPKSYPLEPIVRAIFRPDDMSSNEVDGYIERQPKISEAWTTTSPFLRRLFVFLEEEGVALDTIAIIRQGIKTGANYVYVLELAGSLENEVVEVKDSKGRRYFLERDLLRPVSLGNDISRYREFKLPSEGSSVLIYPYDNGRIIDEKRLREEYPGTYKYLTSYRLELESRVSIVGGTQTWYSLVRPRDSEWLDSSKILSRDLVASPSFSIDTAGLTYLIGGIAVVPADTDYLFPLLGLMNSRMFGTILRVHSAEYQGQYIKIEPGKLAEIFIPTALLDKPELDFLVRRRLISPEIEWQAIDEAIDILVSEFLFDGN